MDSNTRCFLHRISPVIRTTCGFFALYTENHHARHVRSLRVRNTRSSGIPYHLLHSLRRLSVSAQHALKSTARSVCELNCALQVIWGQPCPSFMTGLAYLPSLQSPCLSDNLAIVRFYVSTGSDKKPRSVFMGGISSGTFRTVPRLPPARYQPQFFRQAQHQDYQVSREGKARGRVGRLQRRFFVRLRIFPRQKMSRRTLGGHGRQIGFLYLSRVAAAPPVG